MHFTRFLLCCTIIALLSCATTSYQFATVDDIHSLVDPKTSTLPAYDLTGGLWLDNQSLYINKEFNFGMAMSIEGAGVAIAVGMRTNQNKALAEQLSALPPLQLNERLSALLSNTPVSVENKRIVVYGILFGQPQAHLRTVLELYPPSVGGDVDSENESAVQKMEPDRFVYYSQWLPATGEGSWSDLSPNEGGGQLLWRAFDESLPALIELADTYHLSSADNDSPVKRYSISGGEAVQRGEGKLIVEKEGHSIIQSASMPKTILSVPSELVEFMDAAPPP